MNIDITGVLFTLSMSIIKLNVKRAIVISMFIEGLSLIHNAKIQGHVNS